MQRQARAPRRSTEWFTLDRRDQGLATDDQTNETLFNATSVGARSVKGTTITRMLIDLNLRAGSIAQRVNLYWGILVMNADARAAGAFPEADDVSDRAGWMVRGNMSTIMSDLSDGSQWLRIHRDIRSQRILHTEEDELQLILDSSASGFTLRWDAYIRVLVKWA